MPNMLIDVLLGKGGLANCINNLPSSFDIEGMVCRHHADGGFDFVCWDILPRDVCT